MPSIPKGIDSIPAGQIPDTWDKNWFTQFIRTWLRAADVRNATAVLPITIKGNGTTPATISMGGQTVTVTTPKLTPTGSTGTLVFTNGVLTSHTQAT